jgi:transposase
MPASPDTVRRRVKVRLRGHRAGAVCVLGVDDRAWRKQQRYGTMLMDMERNNVIDLLQERSAESFAAWLGGHPEVGIITRDRSSLYADGGRRGAPAAVQVTDRYHLVSNLAYGQDTPKIGTQRNKILLSSQLQRCWITSK